MRELEPHTFALIRSGGARFSGTGGPMYRNRLDIPFALPSTIWLLASCREKIGRCCDDPTSMLPRAPPIFWYPYDSLIARCLLGHRVCNVHERPNYQCVVPPF